MIELINNQPDNILAFAAHGQVTGKDYDVVVIPAIEDKLKGYQKIRLLYHLGNDFSGFDTQSLWRDAQVGLQHLNAWEKIAVVSNRRWILSLTKVLGLLIPCPVKVFTENQLDKANDWLKT